MPAIRGMGIDDQGNIWIEPNWSHPGQKIGLSSAEIAVMDNTGQPISVLLFHLQTASPFTDNPVIVDPTKAANAKALTLQQRLDGLMGMDGQFYAGQVVVTVDKATQVVTVSDS